MRFTKPAFFLFTLLSLFNTFNASAEPPAVLKQIPSSAEIIVVVSDLNSLNTKAVFLGTKLGQQMPPDPFGMLTLVAGINEGWQTNGSAALVCTALGNEPILILPTTDTKKFLKNLQPKELENGILSVQLPFLKQGYATILDDHFVAFACQKNDLTNYLNIKVSNGSNSSVEAFKTFENHDITLYVNIHTTIAAIVESMNAAELQSCDLSFKEFLQKTFVDTDAMTLGLLMNDEGTAFDLTTYFKTAFDSTAKQNELPANFWQGLPWTNDYLMAGAGSWTHSLPVQMGNNLINFLSKAMEAGIIKNNDNCTSLKNGFNAWKEFYSLVSADRFVLYTENDTSTDLITAYIADSKDPAKAQHLYLNISKQKEDLFKASDFGFKYKIEITEEEIALQHIKVAKVVETKTLTPEEGLVLKGKEGEEIVTSYATTLNDKLLILAAAKNSEAHLSHLIDAVKENKDQVSQQPQIAKLKNHITPNANFVSYLSLNKLLLISHDFCCSYGLNTKPSNKLLSPVVFSIGTQEKSSTLKIYIPLETLQSCAESF